MMRFFRLVFLPIALFLPILLWAQTTTTPASAKAKTKTHQKTGTPGKKTLPAKTTSKAVKPVAAKTVKTTAINPKPKTVLPSKTVHKNVAINSAATIGHRDSTHRKATLPKQHKDTAHHVSHTAGVLIVPKVKKDSVLHATDSTHKKATTPIVKKNTPNDTLSKAVVVKHLANKQWMPDSRLNRQWAKAAYLPMQAKPVYLIDEQRKNSNNDYLFFTVAGLLLLYGIARAGFPRYLQQLFQYFTNPGAKVKRDRDTGQYNLPSLIFNFLFCISAGLCSTLLLQHYQVSSIWFWQLWLYATAFFAGIYLVKYIVVSAIGWILNVQAETGTYTYIVFMVNKLIGLTLLPLILILSFSDSSAMQSNGITIIGIFVILLLAYRYIISVILIGKNMQTNILHFFIYLCCVEILPMLVFYKLFSNSIMKYI